jgi:hypothetical protein
VPDGHVETGRSRRRAVVAAALRHPVEFARRRRNRRSGMSLTTTPPIGKAEVLERLVGLPVHTWTYGWDDESVKHMGPMAQDFAAAFGLGDRDDIIDMVDANGVLMAAVQALLDRVVALENEVAALRESGAPNSQSQSGR